MSKLLTLSCSLKADPKEVYETLIDANKHAELIGADAKIDPRVGGKFEMWEGSIYGEIVELVPNEKIVEKWHADYDGWDEGHFSTLTFEMKKIGDETELTLTQEDIPEKDFDNVKNGWKDYYFVPLEKKFNLK